MTARADSRSLLGVVLAGGQSRRMRGREKTLLRLGNRPLIGHVLERLRPQVDALVVNANGDGERFREFGLPVIADANADGMGPLAGVLAGMDWARERGFARLITVAGDTPFFPGDLAERLVRAAGATAPIALAATPCPERGARRHPTFGLWPVALADDLRRQLAEGVRKIVAWTDRHGAAVAEFDAGPPDPFFNVNTPEDFEMAGAILGEISR